MDCDSDPSTCINEQLIKEMADRMAEAARGERSPVRGYFCVAVPISGREGCRFWGGGLVHVFGGRWRWRLRRRNMKQRRQRFGSMLGLLDHCLLLL